MKGFAMLDIGKTGWIEKETPTPGPLDAIVRPIAVAPCTSDVHTVWEGALGKRTNMILGHEAVGEVAEVGSLVKDFKPGDKVIVSAITPDWSSLGAQGGYAMHSGGVLGGWKFSNFKDGVFSEFFHVNDADGNLAMMPEGMDPAEATMLSDMVPTGLRGAEMADIQFGDTVAVIGIGPVGLMAVAASAIRGASTIYAVGSRQVCVDVALKYGATEIIDYHNGDMVEQIMEKNNGVGVDRAIVAGGDEHSIAQAVRLIKPGGRVSNINYFGSGDCLDIPRLDWGCGMADKTIVGGLMPGGRLRSEKLATLLVTGRLDVAPMITHRFEGFDKIDEALSLMKDKPRDMIKPVVMM